MLSSPAHPVPPPRRNPLVALTGWGFVLCAAVAVSYGLWALYGSGESVASFDVRPEAAPEVSAPFPAGGASCLAFGPVELDPALNPHRAVLRAGFAPLGSSRIHYAVALRDDAGRTLWEHTGAFGGPDDEDAFVRVNESLLEFDLERRGSYTVEVRYTDGSLDDLREASLELRGGIVRMDTRITWGFGLAAFACLFTNLWISRRRDQLDAPADEEMREAA